MMDQETQLLKVFIWPPHTVLAHGPTLPHPHPPPARLLRMNKPVGGNPRLQSHTQEAERQPGLQSSRTAKATSEILSKKECEGDREGDLTWTWICKGKVLKLPVFSRTDTLSYYNTSNTECTVEIETHTKVVFLHLCLSLRYIKQT